MSNSPINLDINASFGVIPEVYAKLGELSSNLLNPTSVHQGGQSARALIEEARDEVRRSFNIPSEYRIVFTSGATESNNTALSLLHRGKLAESELLTTSVEHPSILECADALARSGVGVVKINPLAGREAFTPDSVCAQITSKTKLVSIMSANNETGEIFPIQTIFRAIRKINPSIILHTDAVQIIGKTDISLGSFNADLISISAHKVGGLTGCGALLVHKRLDPHPLLRGGPQESRWRAGTENLTGIVSFGVAARYTRNTLITNIDSMSRNTEKLLALVRSGVSDLVINRELSCRLPNTLNLRVPGIKADDLVIALDLAGVYVSSGAACASGKPEPSHVLLAHGLSEKAAKESIRLSLHPELTVPEIERSALEIVSAILRIRGGSGVLYGMETAA